jgi:imidazolonepropionase-like amidohydrolase
VLVVDGKIADADFHGQGPKAAHEVHCEHCTLLPGLIDSHVHAFKDAELPLLYGITTELDMFMSMQQAKPVKDRMAAGHNEDAADLFTAGTLITAPGGHGTEYGIPIPTLSRPEDADAFVQARIAEGSDYIKLVYDGGAGWGGNIPTLDLPTLTAAIAAAHQHGKLAVVHVQDEEHGRQAIAAGADGLAHLFTDKPADAAFVKLAAEHKAFIVPTYTVMESFSGRNAAAGLLAAPRFNELLDTTQAGALKQQLRKMDLSARVDMAMHASITALHAAGVPILAGPDAGNPGVLRGISLHRELELLVKAGLTPTEALRAATSAPADAFHLTDRGRIAKGRKADLLLVNGDPTSQITATRDIVGVWKDGKPNDALRSARLAEVKAARDALAASLGLPLPADGRISLFSAGSDPAKPKLDAPFGGWLPTTDAIASGKSDVSLQWLGDSAALAVGGELKAGFTFPWSGLMYYPGSKPFEPADLSNASSLRFKVRGDGGDYQLLAYWREGGYVPASVTFKAGADWQEVTIPFNKLTGFNPKTAVALDFVATGAPHAFQFQIADVRLMAN